MQLHWYDGTKILLSLCAHTATVMRKLLSLYANINANTALVLMLLSLCVNDATVIH